MQSSTSSFFGSRVQSAQSTARVSIRQPLNVVNLRPLRGKVVSVAMDKTAVVQVDRLVPHRIYGKRMRVSKKFFAQDEEHMCKVGDDVEIISIPPISKKKCFKIRQIMRKSDL